MKEGYWSKKVDVQRAKVQSSELSINLISQDYGMNLNYLGCFPFIPKLPKISVGIQMERSVSISSDRNIRDHLWRWSTYFGWDIPIQVRRSIFDKPVVYPN